LSNVVECFRFYSNVGLSHVMVGYDDR
jgi:hypothetical protein